MWLAAPSARIVLAIVLVMCFVAVMMARLSLADRSAPTTQGVSFAGHSAGSMAHERNAYRLKLNGGTALNR